MNTQLMEYIIAISEEKSITRAAERLMVTQPAISRQLTRLEKELGVPLFSREHNRMILTDAGRIYVNGARQILSIYDHAVTQITQQHHLRKQHLTLVYDAALLSDLTAQVLPPFRTAYPDVQFSAIDGNSLVTKDYLRNDLAQIGIFTTTLLHASSLELISLYNDELMLALPADHPTAIEFRKNGVNFQQIIEEPFILNQWNSHFRSMEEEILKHNQIHPNVLLETTNLKASIHMLKNKMGIAFLPRSFGESKDIALFPIEPAPKFHVVIAYHKSTILTKAEAGLIRILQETYKN